MIVETPLKVNFIFLSFHFSLPLFPCYSPTCAVLKVSHIPIEGKTPVEIVNESKFKHVSKS